MFVELHHSDDPDEAFALMSKAVAFLDALLARHPTSEDALFLKGSTLRSLGDYEGAVSVFESIQQQFGMACMRCVSCCNERVRSMMILLRSIRQGDPQVLAKFRNSDHVVGGGGGGGGGAPVLVGGQKLSSPQVQEEAVHSGASGGGRRKRQKEEL